VNSWESSEDIGTLRKNEEEGDDPEE